MDILTDSRQVRRLDVVDTGRRRRWSDAEKLRIVEESFSGPRLVSATARRHGISNQLLFSWRKAYREGQLGGREVDGFVPARDCVGGPVDDGACRIGGGWHSGGRDREWPTRDRGSERRCRGFATDHTRAGDTTVIPIPTGVRVWLATGHTDMRCGFPSLALRVQEMFKRDPWAAVSSASGAKEAIF